jgi:hypothetical protein
MEGLGATAEAIPAASFVPAAKIGTKRHESITRIINILLHIRDSL